MNRRSPGAVLSFNIENAFTLTQAKFRGGDRNENDHIEDAEDELSLIHISEPTRPERIGGGGGWV